MKRNIAATTQETAAVGGAEGDSIGSIPTDSLDPDRTRHWLIRIRSIVGKHRMLSMQVFLAAIGAIIFQTAIPTLLGKTFDSLGVSLRQNDSAHLHRALALFIAAGFARSLMNFLVRFSLFKLTYRIEADLRKMVYRHLLVMPLSFMSRYRTGQIVSRANSDIRTIQTFLLYLPYTGMVFGTFFLSIIYMFAVNASLALLAIASLPCIFLLSLRLRRAIYPLSWLVQSRMADVATVVDENIRGQSAIKLFNRQPQQIEALRKAAGRLRWATKEMIRYRARYLPWIENIAVLGQIAILLYGGWLVIGNRLQLGQLVTFNVYVIMMLVPFNTLGQVLVMGRNAAAAASRVFEILDEAPAEIGDEASTLPVDVSGAIEFAAVRYEAQEASDRSRAGSHLVLDDLDAAIEAGRITAIVGKTGSGKSTMANLLAGLATPTSGSILIDGMDTAAIGARRLRQRVMLVPQESFLFTDSIANNIGFGSPGIEMDAIEHAARIADAHDFILDQPQGYDTPVGEGGSTLSGGQRQRITIAQAILMKPSVLILDDATSALDSITENQVIESIKREMRGKTVIIISHRATMAQHSDEVLLLHGGRIVASGSHAQLMATQPLYQQVFLEEDEAPVEEQVGSESDQDFYQRIGNSVRGAAMVEIKMGDAI